MRALRWTALGAGTLLLVTGAILAWLLASQPGARWLAARTQDALDGRLAIRGVEGTIAGPLVVHGLRYVDPKSGMEVRVERATLAIAMRELLTQTVRVRSATADDVSVRLGQSRQGRPRNALSLDPPINVVVDAFTLRRARIDRNETRVVTVQRAALAGRWTDAGLAISRLEVDAREGSIRFAGEVRERSQKYVGRGSGRFRWRLGEQTYAGRLHATSDTRAARLDLRLTAPVAARLETTVEQRAGLPWRFELDVPRFDPRSRLAPDGAIASLGGHVRGRGDRDEASLTAEVLVNGERVQLESVRAAFSGKRIDLETLTVRIANRAGMLEASGHVELAAEPVMADLAVRWEGVELPPEWVGQPLATEGSAAVRGNPARYEARATLAIGPPRRAADVSLALNGTRDAIQVEHLGIVQQPGRLTVRGDLQLRPALTWKLAADASDFDPGALLAGWPGRLRFALASEGRLEPEGPRASFDLQRLGGTLRHRRISGAGQLILTPDRVVAGKLHVASGGSTIRIEGSRGAELDLAVLAEVDSLDDWLPRARGTLRGAFDVAGRWPHIHVDGTARGHSLAIGDSSAGSVRLSVALEDVTNPRGSVTLAARTVRAGGFEFAEIGAHAQGGQDDHRVRVRARGTPLSAELSAQGGRQGKGWAGAVENLALEAQGVPRLALQAPVRVLTEGRRFRVSEACLSGADISVCVAGSGEADGALNGRYAISKLPLALVQAVTAPDLPLDLAGTLEGRGNFSRDPDGALAGDAELHSDSGRVAQLEGETLLTYERLQLAAQLRGDAARATLKGVLGREGSVDAEIALAGLRAPSPTVRGRGTAVVDDLRAVEIFTAQVASVQGRVEARASVGGTLGSLGIDADARVSDFAAEVPALGLKLRDGQFEADMQPGGRARFTGRISSADGQVKIDGVAEPTGLLAATIKGNQVLAADIPAGRIVVNPDLKLTRTPERVRLEGTVAVPNADIDLTKLPAGRGPRPSPDVVVLDEPPEEKDRREFPLHTDVRIVLGPNVELTGFGLDAEVQGQLVVREIPGESPVASGEVRLQGTYKAYGQDLIIQEGRLLYAATPLNDPRLDIVAVRKLPDVTAKLLVTGTARRPVLAVSSDPPMSQTEALSYLVRGKPVNQLTSEDNDLLQTAARSLGGALGNLLARNLGRRLGVDEIGITQSTELGGSAFTVGEYLSPRLYLSYGFGLFEPGEVVTLRYEISEEFALSASQGPQGERAGIEYRIER